MAANHRRDILWGLAAGTLLVLILILLTPRGPRDTWDGWFAAEMRSALRNLATAEEQYHSQHGTYTTELEALDTASFYVDRVGLTVSHADSRSWEATATHEFLTTTCTMSRNDSSVPLFPEACTKRQYSKAWEACETAAACLQERDAPVFGATQLPDTALSAASDRIGNVDSLPQTPGSILPLLSAYGYSLGEERVTVVARLGPPDSVTAGPGIFGADTTFALWYPEAVVQVAHWNADEHELMGGIRVWGTLPDLPAVVLPGVTTRSDLRAWLGRPRYKPQAVADTTVWTYSGGGWATELISFYMVRDTVRVIFLQFRMG